MCHFVYNCDVWKTIERVPILSESFIRRSNAMLTMVNMKGPTRVFFRNNYTHYYIFSEEKMYSDILRL